MSTSVLWKILDSARIFPRVEVVGQAIRRLFGNLNTAYEVTWDALSPDGSSQLWAGHDHSEEGGLAIVRSSQYTADDYTQAVFSKTDYSPGQAPNAAFLGYFYTSPRMADSSRSRQLEIAICCQAVNSAIDVWSGTGSKVTVQPGDPDWIFLKRPITKDKDWSTVYLYTQPVDPESASGLEFYLYSFNVVETYTESQPQEGGKFVSTGVTGEQTIYSYFDTLVDEFGSAEEWLDAIVTKRATSAINFLVEGILDIAAIGASSQACKGHDHYAIGDGGYGGRAVGMGKVFSAFGGNTGSPSYFNSNYGWLLSAAGSSNVWQYADDGFTPAARRTSGSPGGVITTTPIFYAWITGGFSSSGNPPTSAPYLDGWFFISASSNSASCDVRIYNLTTATYSTTVVTATLDAWNYIDGIPCSEGAWNDYAIEVQCTDEEGVEIEIRGLVMGESYEYNGAKVCYVSSSGTRVLGKARSGWIVVPS